MRTSPVSVAPLPRRAAAHLESLERRLLFTIPGTNLGVWQDYTALSAELQTIHNAYPNLTQVISIGKTAQNRDLWAIRITDNPTVEEDEPEFFYNGSIHGDEPVGMEMTFYFMQHLLENYGTDTRISNLVNNMDLWIVPNMNWDGYSVPGRGNANNIDLNRNFPEWTSTPGGFGNMFDGPAPNTSGKQPETIAMVNWRRTRNFVASANFHGGAQVVNYPWDVSPYVVDSYAVHPDDAVFREFSKVYANQNPNLLSGGFAGGITNGADWYEITGGMQDWAVMYTGAFETTIELYNTKFPSQTLLPTLWNNNRESMLQYMEAANWGVRGIVSDIGTGAPLGAKITVIAPAPSPAPDPGHPATQWTFSDADLGDWHRMLLPGIYSLRFEAPGYQTQTISGVVVAARTNDPTTTARLNVQMVPTDTTAPTVTSGQSLQQSAPQSLKFTFNENVGASLSTVDLLLENLTTASTISPGDLSLNYDGGTNTATFTFPDFSYGALPDGNYRATLQSGGITDPAGNPLAADHVLNFSFLAGDANFDNRVDSDDFNILAISFGLAGKTFSQGNFNYDALGVVDSDDFNILAGNFGVALGAGTSMFESGPRSESFADSAVMPVDATADHDELLTELA